MRSRRLYLWGVIVMMALGVGLLFMPFHDSPPAGNSDMQFYGMTMSLFAVIVLGMGAIIPPGRDKFGAIIPPDPDDPLKIAIGGVVGVSFVVIASAYLVAWFG